MANLSNINNKFLVTTGGNVGIGVTSPSRKLTVSNAANGDIALFTNTSDADLNINLTSGVTLLSPSTGILALGTSNTERMRIDSSGNVGINNTNPSAFNSLGGLQTVIGSGSGNANLTLYSASTDYSHVAFTDTNSSGSTGQYVGLLQYYHVDDSLRIYTNSAERMRIDSSGNVGIGVTPKSWTVFTPIQIGQASSFVGRTSLNQTDVCNNWYYDGAEKRINTGYAQRYVQDNSGAHYWLIGGTDAADSAISFSTAMYIKNDGNVGIGYTNPGSKLSVNGDGGFVSNSSSRVLYLTQQSAGNGNIIQFLDQSGNNVWELVGRNTNFYIYNNQNSVGYVFESNASNGYVAILKGGTDASYPLDVTGSIRSTADVIAYSDRRVKENIKTIDNALDKVTKLRGVSYNRKDIEDKSTKIGVIAQEVKDILPEVVDQDGDDKYSVAYGNMAGLFIEAIKELEARVKELENK